MGERRETYSTCISILYNFILNNLKLIKENDYTTVDGVIFQVIDSNHTY